MMNYRCIVVNHARADKMAEAIEKQANKMAKRAYELVTFSITGTGKGILVFRTPGEAAKKTSEEAGVSKE